jgi:TatD DNase family protein
VNKINSSTFIDFHTHHATAQEGVFSIKNHIVGKDERPEDCLFSAGIHPWFTDEKNVAHHFSLLKSDALHRSCLMLGECGLDKLIPVSMERQLEVFTEHIRLAEEIQKPIVVHCVKAFSELISLKKKLKPSVPMIVHGYNNNVTIAKILIADGFYFSFGAALLQEKSNASKVLPIVPTSHFFLETDDKSQKIESIYTAAAKILNIEMSFLQKNIFENLQKMFNY